MATRRLPVIQQQTGDDAEAAARPAWQWVLIGSGLLVTIWTPTVAVALAIARKISAARAGGPPLGPAVAAGLVAATFALSSIAAGYLVARFGPRTQLRHALFAGLAAAAEIWLLAWLGAPSTLACRRRAFVAMPGQRLCALGAGSVAVAPAPVVVYHKARPGEFEPPMSVDQELARALEEAEAEAPAVAQATGGAPPTGPKPKRNLGLLVGLLVIVAGILGLVFTSFEGAAIYSVGVDQLMKEPARYSQRAIRVKHAVKGTLARRDDPCEYASAGRERRRAACASIRRASCPTPSQTCRVWTSRAGRGQAADDGKTFVSSNIVAKCPVKYEMKQKSWRRARPHSGPQSSPLQTLSQKD